MMEPDISAKVETSVSIQPALSQTFLVSLLGLSAVSLVSAAVLLGMGIAAGWIFLALALIPMVGAIAGWWKSQSDIDLASAHPTNLALPDGLKLSADPRTIRDLQAVKNVSQILGVVLNRQPIPDADGLVSSDLKVIPNSKHQAQQAIEEINNDTQAITNSLFDAMKLSEDETTIAPVVLTTAAKLQ